MSNTKHRIPEKYRPQIIADLGKDTDTAIARKWTDIIRGAGDVELRLGWAIDRHTIFWMRQQAKVKSFRKRPYTAPAFRGKIEDAHPEIIKLLGEIPFAKLAKHYEVSRSTIYEASKRLGKNNKIDYERRIKQLLKKAA